MGLVERRHVPHQTVRARELGERQLRGFIGRGAACHQLPPAIVEMLREFFDDLGLARW
jgi:hypothetical protein